MKKSISLFSLYLLMFCSIETIAQEIKTMPVGKSTLPSSMQYTGVFKKAFKWTNGTMDNYIIYTETKKQPTGNREEGTFSKSVYVYYYVQNGTSVTLVWKITDGVKDCAYDIMTSCITKAFNVTDLNKDGVPEIWAMYKSTCTSDVSPWNLKLIMCEGKNKYAIRGITRTYVLEDEKYAKEEDSEKTIDQSFKNGNKLFLIHAEKMWVRFNIPNL